LSSHILAEVQQVCTSATIIGNGRTLASGPVDELIGAGTSHRVVVPDPVAAQAVLVGAGFTVAAQNGHLLVDGTDPAAINRTLGAAGIWLAELTPVRADLETVF